MGSVSLSSIAFYDSRGYEAWRVVSISQVVNLIAAILANPVMINAYLAGVPNSGKPFPEGAKMETSPAATASGGSRLMVKGRQEVRGQRRVGMAVLELDALIRYVPDARQRPNFR